MRWTLHTIAIILPILIGFLILSRPSQPVPEVLWEVPAFNLTDQESQPFGNQQMRGHVWVAGFVYTHCPDVCPLITQRMAALRDSLQSEGKFGNSVRFASFTVDPDRDTPDVLRAYATSFGVSDAQEWRFLTGQADTMFAVINRGFHLNAARADEQPAAADPSAGSAGHAHPEDHTHDAPAGEVDGYMVGHSDRLVLIDHEGQVRGTYISSDPDAMAQLRQDLGVLIRRM